ncbi:MAG: DUF3159 domain-containing protein [Anaerolineales bacterium]|nr:DUF3159 domain-containing protein [Anaerolineales bacterium]
MSKIKELQAEFQAVFVGRGTQLLDSFLPLLIFLAANLLFGTNVALWAALGVATLLAAYRIFQRQNLVYALGGLGGVVLAAVFVKLNNSAAGFFLPGLISGAITVILCVVSVALNRPVVAWSSFIARRWPLKWYWHPKVLPAYNEVTIMWAVAFAARLALEYWLYQRQAVGALGAIKIFLGWPYTILLLIVSYLYGVWRLGQLHGPSVEEFITDQAPPWEGQKRGF